MIIEVNGKDKEVLLYRDKEFGIVTVFHEGKEKEGVIISISTNGLYKIKLFNEEQNEH